MDTLSAARAQMGMSLAFHMVFAAAGIGMPLLLLIAEWLWLRSGKPHYLELAKKWAKATGLLFAIGAVSGTALAFELGLLWPGFMAFAGSVVGPAFALEGFAFFIEAIFLGLYLYGWEKLPPRGHWWCGMAVAVSGLLSGALVTAVNAWMQAPVGLDFDASGRPVIASDDPLATFRSPLWLPMALHSSLSCYMAVGFATAGVYAMGMLRGRRDDYHRSALHISMTLALIASVLQPVSGDLNARLTARYQPAKLAAMEALFETRAGAPLLIGGIPDETRGTVALALEIPRGLSLLAAHDADAVITGLYDFAPGDRPSALWVHLAFQVMVGCGLLLLAVALWFAWAYLRRGAAEGRWLLRAILVSAPLGFLALEAGWLVSELGRQPWTIHGYLRTAAAATPSTDVGLSLFVFTLLYMLLGAVLAALLMRLGRSHDQ
jgi:cytochrome d ubiquinol oxidase subunit I